MEFCRCFIHYSRIFYRWKVIWSNHGCKRFTGLQQSAGLLQLIDDNLLSQPVRTTCKVTSSVSRPALLINDSEFNYSAKRPSSTWRCYYSSQKLIYWIVQSASRRQLKLSLSRALSGDVISSDSPDALYRTALCCVTDSVLWENGLGNGRDQWRGVSSFVANGRKDVLVLTFRDRVVHCRVVARVSDLVSSQVTRVVRTNLLCSLFRAATWPAWNLRCTTTRAWLPPFPTTARRALCTTPSIRVSHVTRCHAWFVSELWQGGYRSVETRDVEPELKFQAPTSRTFDSSSGMICSVESWKPLYYLHNSLAPQTRVVDLEFKFQAPAPSHQKFSTPAPTFSLRNLWLRLKAFCPLKTKNIVFLVQVAYPTNYVRETGTQISGSGILKFLTPAPAVQNRLGSGSTALVETPLVPFANRQHCCAVCLSDLGQNIAAERRLLLEPCARMRWWRYARVRGRQMVTCPRDAGWANEVTMFITPQATLHQKANSPWNSAPTHNTTWCLARSTPCPICPEKWTWIHWWSVALSLPRRNWPGWILICKKVRGE